MVGTITILSSEWKFILIPIALVVCILYFDSPWGLETYLPMGKYDIIYDIMALPRNTINHPGLTYLCRRLEPGAEQS